MVLPNQLTILRIILTPVFLFLFLAEDPVLKQVSFGVFFIAALTDWYDGWLARKFNYITSWGKFWDPLADKILTSAAFLGFVFAGVLELWMVIIIILRDMLVTSLRVFAEYRQISFTTSYYAKWKTFLQMLFLYYLLIVYLGSISASVYKGNEKLFSILLNEDLIYYSMLLITVITFHSGATYLYKNKNLLIRLIKSET
jgi:CDP-diacylglycerol--glycerol-3-phosphate 3-phosphatidyltransferase